MDKTLPRINNTINFVKAIACVAVVLIHCRFPGAVGALIRTLARFAVPFFTVISGFYLTKSNSETASVLSLKRKTKHMLKLIIGAELFAFIVLVAGDLILNHSLNSTLFVYSDPSRWIKFIWDNTPLTYTHFWYLYALLYCYVTALLIVKIKNKLGGGKQLAIVASVLFVLFYGMSVMSNLALPVQFKFSIGREDNISAIYNLFILRSMPFFLLGIVLRIYDEEIRKSNLLSKKNILMCILAGGLLSIVERFVFGDIQIFVGTTLMVVAIFSYCIKYPSGLNSRIEEIGNKLSLYVYITHVTVMEGLNFILTIACINTNPIIQWLRPVVVVIISLLCSNVFYEIRRGIKNKTQHRRH